MKGSENLFEPILNTRAGLISPLPISIIAGISGPKISIPIFLLRRPRPTQTLRYITSSSHHIEETDAGLDRPLYLRNKCSDKTLKRSALWLYNTSWLDQNLSKRFLKQLTVSAETIWFERLFHMGITRLVKLNFLKS